MEAGARSWELTSWPTNRRANGNDWELFLSKSFPSDMLPLAMLHHLNLSKPCHQLKRPNAWGCEKHYSLKPPQTGNAHQKWIKAQTFWSTNANTTPRQREYIPSMYFQENVSVSFSYAWGHRHPTEENLALPGSRSLEALAMSSRKMWEHFGCLFTECGEYSGQCTDTSDLRTLSIAAEGLQSEIKAQRMTRIATVFSLDVWLSRLTKRWDMVGIWVMEQLTKTPRQSYSRGSERRVQRDISC